MNNALLILENDEFKVYVRLYESVLIDLGPNIFQSMLHLHQVSDESCENLYLLISLHES
jgi:hypothetical protein